MTSTVEVAKAEARAGEARQRLIGTFEEIQHRLTAAALAQDAVEIASESAVKVARSAAEAVRARPMTVAAVLGAVGLLAARGPITRLFTRKTPPSKDETPAGSASSTPRRTRRLKGS